MYEASWDLAHQKPQKQVGQSASAGERASRMDVLTGTTSANGSSFRIF